jgi:hypothetical protein
MQQLREVENGRINKKSQIKGYDGINGIEANGLTNTGRRSIEPTRLYQCLNADRGYAAYTVAPMIPMAIYKCFLIQGRGN